MKGADLAYVAVAAFGATADLMDSGDAEALPTAVATMTPDNRARRDSHSFNSGS